MPSSIAASPRIDVKDDKTFTLHVDKLTFDYAGDQRFRDAAGASRARRLRRSGAIPHPHAATTPTRPIPASTTDPTGSPRWRRARISCSSPTRIGAGRSRPFRRITVRDDREHRGARSQSAVRHDRHGGGRARPSRSTRRWPSRSGTATQFQIIYKPGLIYEHVDCNLDNPILADRRVRQALLLRRSTARRSASQLFAGRQTGRRQLRQPARLGLHRRRAALSPTTRPRRARCSTRRAGTRQPTASRRNANGEPLSLELTTTAGNRTRELVEQVLQSQWRKIGVDIRIKNEPARVLFGETLPHRRFELAMYAWISAPGERAALDPPFERDPERRQRLCRPELRRASTTPRWTG